MTATLTATQTISADFPFESRFVEVNGSKIHYIDEGAGDPILFLHGQPTSSYLWRNIIPHVTSAGRAIAMDLVGFGKSDKPDIEYRFFDHVKYVEGFIDKLGLKNITLVIHDWGSGLGFHYAMRNEDNIKGLAFMEPVLMPWSYEVEMGPFSNKMPQQLFETFQTLRGPDSRELLKNQNVFVEQLLPGMTIRDFTEEELNVYRAPFLDPSSREPVWRWPQEVPIDGEPADVHQAVVSYGDKLQQSELPKLLFYATPGVIITEPVLELCKRSLKNLTTVNIGPGVHYLQEDNPHLIGSELANWYRTLG